MSDLESEQYWRHGSPQTTVAQALSEACCAIYPLHLELRCAYGGLGLMVAPYCAANRREHALIAFSDSGSLTDAEIIATIRRVVAGVLYENAREAEK